MLLIIYGCIESHTNGYGMFASSFFIGLIRMRITFMTFVHLLLKPLTTVIIFSILLLMREDNAVTDAVINQLLVL